MSGDSVLLLTACINPNGMPETAIQDSDVRLSQYLTALEFYLHTTDFKIVFVENSGYDLSANFQSEISSGRMEFITFQGNDFDHSLGKGYGESLVIEKALADSKLLRTHSVIIKVTGRHIVKNINVIHRIASRLASSSSFVVCEINKRFRGAKSDLFIGTFDFFERFIANKHKINESIGVWFEHVLFETIEEHCKHGGEFQFLPVPMKQSGQSGSMGVEFKKPSIKMNILHAVKAVLYKVKLMKVI